MATIANNILTSGVVNTVTRTALSGTDTLSVKAGNLYVDNTTGSQVDLVIDGDGASAAYPCPGAVTSDLTGGYTLEVPANSLVELRLGDISGYTAGTVAITGGSASVFAWIVN